MKKQSWPQVRGARELSWQRTSTCSDVVGRREQKYWTWSSSTSSLSATRGCGTAMMACAHSPPCVSSPCDRPSFIQLHSSSWILLLVFARRAAGKLFFSSVFAFLSSHLDVTDSVFLLPVVAAPSSNGPMSRTRPIARITWATR